MGDSVQASGSDVYTYHCICTTLIVATTFPLGPLPTRAPPAQDAALILDTRKRPGRASTLPNTMSDYKQIIVRREDGFEKRILVRCARCNLVIGYHLDSEQVAATGARPEDVLYLLPGGIRSTEDMKNKTAPKVPVWAIESA